MTSRRLVKALTPAATVALEGATVTAVGSNVVTIDLLGVTVANCPYLGTGWDPAVDDVVSVAVSGSRVLVLGPVAPGGDVGGGGGGSPITVSSTAPPSPAINDLWVEVP